MSTSDILNLAIPALVTALIAAFGVVTKALWDSIKAKTHNAVLDKYIDQANDAILTAVAETMQTFVSSMKNSGQWNEETAKQAFELSKIKAIEIMGAAALKSLPEVVGDFEKWLTAKIEAATLETKALVVPLALGECSDGE